MNQHKGFTLLELVIVVAIVALLFATGMNRLNELTRQAEHVTVEQQLGAMRTGAVLRALISLIDDANQPLHAMTQENPISWLSLPPINYGGELDLAAAAVMKPGYWYFAPDVGQIVYRVRYPEAIETQTEPALLQFKISLDWVDSNGNGQFEHGLDNFQGADLVTVAPYRWMGESEIGGITAWF